MTRCLVPRWLRALVALAAAWLGLTGCAAAPGGTGTPARVLVAVQAARQLQYSATELRVMRVTLTELTTQVRHAARLEQPTVRGGLFAFEALHLPPGTYRAVVQAFVDGGEQVLAGTSTSADFAVAAGQAVSLTMPPMTLATTPVGDWRVTINPAGKGFVVDDYELVLEGFDGRRLSRVTPNRTTTWGNVAAVAGQVSTTSITVRYRRNEVAMAHTTLATASLVAGVRTTTNVNVALP